MTAKESSKFAQNYYRAELLIVMNASIPDLNTKPLPLLINPDVVEKIEYCRFSAECNQRILQKSKGAANEGF